jgi:hypothetical protein
MGLRAGEALTEQEADADGQGEGKDDGHEPAVAL